MLLRINCPQCGTEYAWQKIPNATGVLHLSCIGKDCNYFTNVLVTGAFSLADSLRHAVERYIKLEGLPNFGQSTTAKEESA